MSANRYMTAERALVKELREMCNGHPHAAIPWPHRILHRAADTIEALTAPRVPEGWKMYADDNGVICVENQATGESILVPTYSDKGDLWMRVAGQFFRALLAATQSPAEQHPDDVAVDRFAVAMKKKLAAARAKGRGGWDDPEQCSVEFLAELLAGHTTKGNSGNFIDVANFAMMLHMRDADPAVMPAAFNRATAPAEPALDEIDMETQLAAKDWVIGNLQLNDRHQEAEIAKLRERVKVLEEALAEAARLREGGDQ